MAGKTLYDKLWEAHEVKRRDDGSSLIYIDRHIIHEVTSPQAFEGLRLANRKPWRIDANIATPDHNVPTTPERKGGIEAIVDQVSRLQVQTLDENCDEYGIVEFKMNDERQGIVHVISPEQGATLPGMTVVCGDSHTSTHGAFGALAHGIGTSEVEHVLATQCLVAKKMKNMLVRVEGQLPALRHRQGYRAGRDRQDRHRRWQRSRHGIRRQCHSRIVDGRPHDHLQHVHRSRRPRGPGGNRCHYRCLRRRAPVRAEGRAVEASGRVVERPGVG